MSTAGKVLAVLCALMLAVWAVMVASVDQLNIEWAKKVDGIKTNITKLKAEVEETQRTADETLTKVNAEQLAQQRDLRLVQNRVTMAERQISNTRESLLRVQLQLENYKQALKTAQAGLEARNAEKTKTTQDVADQHKLVKQFQGENADLTGELVKLRTEFVAALAKNQKEVARQLETMPPLSRHASLVP